MKKWNKWINEKKTGTNGKQQQMKSNMEKMKTWSNGQMKMIKKKMKTLENGNMSKTMNEIKENKTKWNK